MGRLRSCPQEIWQCKVVVVVTTCYKTQTVYRLQVVQDSISFTISSIVGRLWGSSAQQCWIKFHASSSISGSLRRMTTSVLSSVRYGISISKWIYDGVIQCMVSGEINYFIIEKSEAKYVVFMCPRLLRKTRYYHVLRRCRAEIPWRYTIAQNVGMEV